MAAMVRVLGLLAAIVISPAAGAGVDYCVCDPDDPTTLQARQCSLSREALAHPAEVPVFFLKDANPSKPNRLLALPKAVRKGVHTLAGMTPAERTLLWTTAIQKAQETWGEAWGLAVNGEEMRTQCQPHIHIGKFLPAAETRNFIVVEGPAQMPVPKDGSGLWVHPQGDKLHVHLGEQLTETVLLR